MQPTSHLAKTLLPATGTAGKEQIVMHSFSILCSLCMYRFHTPKTPASIDRSHDLLESLSLLIPIKLLEHQMQQQIDRQFRSCSRSAGILEDRHGILIIILRLQQIVQEKIGTRAR